MENFLQQLLNGVTWGGIYALIALGYTMVYGVLKLINFAHGDVYMVGAMTGFYAAHALGFAADPGAANWGQMLNENQLGLATQPWSVMAPVLIIAIFTIATNLMADGLAQLAQRGE